MKIVSFRNDVLPLKNVLFRLALRITMNKEEAEDVVQDTLMKVWDRRDTLQDIDSIEAFSLTICRNIALDIRYVLFTIDRIGNASYLLDEMDL